MITAIAKYLAALVMGVAVGASCVFLEIYKPDKDRQEETLMHLAEKAEGTRIEAKTALKQAEEQAQNDIETMNQTQGRQLAEYQFRISGIQTKLKALNRNIEAEKHTEDELSKRVDDLSAKLAALDPQAAPAPAK